MKIKCVFKNTWTENCFSEEVGIPVSAQQTPDEQCEYAINRVIDVAWAKLHAQIERFTQESRRIRK